MNIQTNLNKAVSFSLVALTATSLSFATVTSGKFAFAQSRGRSVSPPAMSRGMTGTWYLEWTVNGWLHRGRLTIQDNFGSLIVNTTPPNGQTIHAEQKIALKPVVDGYTLEGSKPTYPGSNMENPNYSRDTFNVKPNGIGGWIMENCSNYYGCVPVNMTQL